MMTTARRGALFAASLFVAGSAAAQDCAEPYTADSFRSDLDALTPLFESVDLDGAGANLVQIHDKLVCLDVVVPREDFARYARSESALGFLLQDEDRALRWARAAKFADVDGAWPSIIPEGHPVTTLADDVGPPLWGGPSDSQLLVSRNGGVFANGVFLAQPRLASEVHFLVQNFDRRERFEAARWQDGAAFPESSVEPGDEVFSAPDWFDAASAEPQGLGEAEDFSMAINTEGPDDEGTAEGGEDPVEVEPELPPEPVDDRPVEVRALEAWERAIGVADLNPDEGREMLQEFLDDFGDSGLPEVADARRWMERHPAPEPEPEPEDTQVADVNSDVQVPDRPPREPRVREPRSGGRGSPALRTVSYITAGAALAMYGGAWGTRAAYNGNPSDGTYYATNGLTVASGAAGVAAAGLFITSFAVGGGE